MSEDAKKDAVKEVAATKETVDAKSETKPENRPTEAPKKKSNLILRTVLLAALVIAAAFAIKHKMLTDDFNTALKLKETDIKAAIVKFEDLSENAYGNIKKHANQELLKCYIESGDKEKAAEKLEKMAKDPNVSKIDLAQCYIVLGDAPSNNAGQTKEYYKKAMEIAPEILTPIQRKVIDPSYVLPKPPPPTPEEIAAAKKMDAIMLAEEAKGKVAGETTKATNAAKKAATDAVKALPTVK